MDDDERFDFWFGFGLALTILATLAFITFGVAETECERRNDVFDCRYQFGHFEPLSQETDE